MRSILIEKGKKEVKPSAKAKLAEIVDFIKRCEKDTFISYDSPSDPLLKYKNVLLCERLIRVIQLLKKRFKPIFKEEQNYFEIDRKLLNFLTVVPLANGMRSLEQLVNMLELSNEKIESCRFTSDEIAMIVRNSDESTNPVQTLWDRLAEQNASLKGIQNSMLHIPLTKEDRGVPTQSQRS